MWPLYSSFRAHVEILLQRCVSHLKTHQQHREGEEKKHQDIAFPWQSIAANTIHTESLAERGTIL